MSLDNKIVIDATNYNSSINGMLEEFEGSEIPTPEHLQRYFTSAKLIKAFNNVDYLRLIQLSKIDSSETKASIPIFGDFTESKNKVSEFVGKIGSDAIDGGDLSESWRSQPIYVSPYLRYKNKEYSDPFDKFADAEPILLDRSTAENLIFPNNF